MRTIWFGPVANNQVHAAPEDVFVQCTGDGSVVGGKPTTVCRDLASKPDSFAALMRERGVVDGEPLALRAFSAGGHAVRRFLRDPSVRARVAAVHMADATYEPTHGTFDEGFAAYGSEAARGDAGRVFVATAGSNPNPQGVTDSESLENLRVEIERRLGKPFESVDLPWASKPPVRAWSLGRAMLVDWGDVYSHGAHATELSTPVWNNVVEPWLANSSESLSSGSSESSSGLLVLGLGGVGLMALAGAIALHARSSGAANHVNSLVDREIAHGRY